MRFIQFFSFIVILFLSLNEVVAQVQPISPVYQSQINSELTRRGLTEQEVRERLKQKGIDVDNVTPQELPQIQGKIVEVLNELEAEKKAKQKQQTKAKNATPQNTTTVRILGEDTTKKDSIPTKDIEQVASQAADEIKEKVKKGASVEEAISEELSEKSQKKLPISDIYGQQLFRDKSLSVFRTTNEVKPPDSYVLGAGDIVTISIFGASQFDSQFEINKDGFIQPSQMPKIFLKGVTLGQAKELVKNRFSRFYVFRPEEFALSLTTARTITVSIFGETINYGSFNISAINTAFNALVAAGGPSNIGSVRNIKVTHKGKAKNLDVYSFMNNPALQFEYFLEDNDVIHVPVAEKIIKIEGAINRPMRYELLNNENLQHLVKYAGGLTANAFKDVIQVKRYQNDKQVLIDVNFKDILNNKSDFTLQNGDEVIVRDIPTPIENYANIKGAVELPGEYALDNTPYVSDLLKKGALKKEARTDVAFLVRSNFDGTLKLVQLNPDEILKSPKSKLDIKLERNDTLVVYEKERYTNKFSISVNGAVRDVLVDYPFDPESTMTVKKAILLAGGLKPDANEMAYIIRTHADNIKEKEYLKININDALNNPDNPLYILKPLDEVRVLSKLTFTDATTIAVTGAVRKPGEFQFDKTLRLADALILAGGFRLGAALNRIDIFRLSFPQNQPTKTIVATLEVDSLFNIVGGDATFQLEPFDEIVVRTVPEFKLQRFITLEGEVKYPGRYAIINDNEPISSIIKRAGGLTNEAFPSGATLYRSFNNQGYVVTKVEEALANNASTYNLIVKENDILTIPRRLDLVAIKVENTRASELYAEKFILSGRASVAFEGEQSAKWYILEHAGGFAKNADHSKVTVEYPNGGIKRTKSFLGIKTYPKVVKGSIISVGMKPEKARKEKKEKEPFDWNRALTQLLAVASTAATIILATTALK